MISFNASGQLDEAETLSENSEQKLKRNTAYNFDDFADEVDFVEKLKLKDRRGRGDNGLLNGIMKNSSEEDKSGRPGQAGRQQRQPPAEAQGQEQRPPDEEARAPGGREDEDVADHAAALGVASRQPLNGHHQNGYTATSKPCCRENEMKNAQLTEENVLLQTKLKSANKDLALKEEELSVKISQLDKSYNSSLNEMKGLLTSQKRLGDRWKGEMEILTQRFDNKFKDLSGENKRLRAEIEALKAELEEKKLECYEAKEMNGIYSAKLTKLNRKFKKLKDEDEESYMEMTF